MAHTHEFDCVVCGAHFDDERTLQRHNSDTHTTKQAIDVRAPAEPMGTERARGGSTATNVANPSRPRTPTATPRYGSAGSGGAEFEPGPERD